MAIGAGQLPASLIGALPHSSCSRIQPKCTTSTKNTKTAGSNKNAFFVLPYALCGVFHAAVRVFPHPAGGSRHERAQRRNFAAAQSLPTYQA